tara:strand:+ start:12400 stop:12759 length:360 start_codon:yes stop_codon:yes gene_type:complete
MSWKRKRKISGKNRYYSISKKLRKEKKSNENFEVMFNNLSLEEVIALKLELASKSIGGNLYGLPIWRSLKYVVEDAVLKYALSAARTKKEVARFLGLRETEMRKINWIYNPDSYFEENE